jgi:phenylacetate-CoA ligase
MLETAGRQLRHGWAVTTGRRVRVGDVEALVQHLQATRAEFGRLDGARMQEALAAAVDPKVRAAVDARRWRAAVRAAYRQTPYYRQLLDRRGLRPDDLPLGRVAELPPTPKDALRSLPEAFLSAGAEPALRACTTGSTGVPTACWFSGYELELAAAYGAVFLMLSAGLGPEDVVQVCISSRAVLPVQTTVRSAQLLGAVASVVGQVDPAEALAWLATPMHLPGHKPKPSFLTVTPSYLGELVQAAPRLGYRPADFGLTRIACSGEVLSSALRQRAADVLGAPVLESYGATEIFPVAGMICSVGHLHTNPDQGLVEVLDPYTFRPAEPGAVGTLVVTPFPPYRETTLLLRFATGDLVRVLTEPPRCELAGQPATSTLLGKAAFSPELAGQVLYQRDVLELLEAEPALPLPVRYQTDATADGFDLQVFGPVDDPALVARLERRAADLQLPVRKIVLHDDPAAIDRPQFARAWLRETVVRRQEEAGTWSLR